MNLWSINVPVSFEGTVRVGVPAHLPEEVQQVLAQKLALSRVLAVTDEPERSPDAEACEDFAEFCKQYGIHTKEAEELFDVSQVESVAGDWHYQSEGETFANKYAESRTSS